MSVSVCRGALPWEARIVGEVSDRRAARGRRLCEGVVVIDVLSFRFELIARLGGPQ